MDSGTRASRIGLVAALVVVLGALSAGTAPGTAPASQTPGAPGAVGSPRDAEPGEPAPELIVAELEQALADGLQRFRGMDLEGVLAHVSDRYRSGGLTKAALRQQLLAMFAAHETLHARVRIDTVRMIGDRAWVYSTGDVRGRLRWLGTPVALFTWEREPEVAWYEGGRWRLIGDQQ